MSFQFKQKSQDFFVSENLPFELSWKGDAFYVCFEKVNITTHDVITHLRKKFNVSRMTLWIAWLKDKKAVARQWISIYKRALRQLGGVKAFLTALEEIVVIKETWWHEVPLNLSTPITNSFRIKLRSIEPLSQEEKTKARNVIKKVLSSWYPNLFGDQRFGIRDRNATQWWEILTWVSREKINKVDTRFKLQAYASHIFNEFTQARVNQKKELLDGDIVTWSEWARQLYGVYNEDKSTVTVCPVKSDDWSFFFVPIPTQQTYPFDEKTMVATWPVVWYNLAIADLSTPAGVFEQGFLKSNACTKKNLQKMKEWKIFGLRRPLRVTPIDARVASKKWDILVEFTLPSWSYASVVYDKLMETLNNE